MATNDYWYEEAQSVVSFNSIPAGEPAAARSSFWEEGNNAQQWHTITNSWPTSPSSGTWYTSVPAYALWGDNPIYTITGTNPDGSWSVRGEFGFKEEAEKEWDD